MSVRAGRWGFNCPRVTFSEPPTVGSVCGNGHFLVPRLVTVCVCITPGLNATPVNTTHSFRVGLSNTLSLLGCKCQEPISYHV